MNKTIKLVCIAAICAILAACGFLRNQKPIAPRERTTVVVDNRAVLDMTVYIVRSSGERIRLGMATSLGKTKFTIPAGIVSGATGVRFLADPIGGSRGPTSEEITVLEGDEVTLMIPPN